MHSPLKEVNVISAKAAILINIAIDSMRAAGWVYDGTEVREKMLHWRFNMNSSTDQDTVFVCLPYEALMRESKCYSLNR
jgi:hypothetical protein